jgi:hypothetical protein
MELRGTIVARDFIRSRTHLENRASVVRDVVARMLAPKRDTADDAKGKPSVVDQDKTAHEDMANTVSAAITSALAHIGIHLETTVNLDGRKVGDVVANRMADLASKPLTGGTSPDPRLSPLMPGSMGWALSP